MSSKYHNFRKDVNEKILTMAGDNKDTVKWQLEKKQEILNKTIEGKKIIINGNNVIFDISFNITFPKKWEIVFVLDWAFGSGFDELLKVYTFIHNELTAAGITHDEQDAIFNFLMKIPHEMKVKALPQ